MIKNALFGIFLSISLLELAMLYLAFRRVLAAEKVIRRMRAGILRAQTVINHARWLIYRDWAEADVMLGQTERDLCRTVEERRDDVKPDAEVPTQETLQLFIEAHQDQYPVLYRH